jgi:hypothetical protein
MIENMCKEKTIKVFEGKVDENINGHWQDCDPGLYLGDRRVVSIFNDFYGKTVRVTVEIVDPAIDG